MGIHFFSLIALERIEVRPARCFHSGINDHLCRASRRRYGALPSHLARAVTPPALPGWCFTTASRRKAAPLGLCGPVFHESAVTYGTLSRAANSTCVQPSRTNTAWLPFAGMIFIGGGNFKVSLRQDSLPAA